MRNLNQNLRGYEHCVLVATVGFIGNKEKYEKRRVNITRARTLTRALLEKDMNLGQILRKTLIIHVIK